MFHTRTLEDITIPQRSSRIMLTLSTIATFSIVVGNAYTPPPRRVRNCRSMPLASSFNFAVQKRFCNSHGINQSLYLHQRTSSDGDPLHHHVFNSISYRQVNLEDIPVCYKIVQTFYQEDERSRLDNLRYMQQYAGKYFWCASLPEETDYELKKDVVIGFISSSRCTLFTEECISIHDPKGSILAIHSVVVDPKYQYQDIATAMMKNYLKQIAPLSNIIDTSGFHTVKLRAQSDMLSCYVDLGFLVLRPSPTRQHGYELQVRQDIMESLVRDTHPLVNSLHEISRSTSNPDEGTLFANGRERRRAKLHNELSKLGIDPNEIENHQEKFGTAAIRTYNSFLLPKSVGALAVAESPTRPRVVANSISFLAREFNADQEQWLRNVDRNRRMRHEIKLVGTTPENDKHPIVLVLDNIRSAHNVGNILRLAEAANIDSVRLCGMTPRPPDPKVLKTAMGAAEHVSLGDETEDISSTTNTVLDLKRKGVRIIGVETTENATSYWNTSMQNDHDASSPVAYVFGNELIGIDVQVLRECDEIHCLPTHGTKNSINVATCVGIIVWERIRNLERVRQKWMRQ